MMIDLIKFEHNGMTVYVNPKHISAISPDSATMAENPSGDKEAATVIYSGASRVWVTLEVHEVYAKIEEFYTEKERLNHEAFGFIFTEEEDEEV